MKLRVLGPTVCCLLFAVSLASPVVAAELLDVKPVVSATGVEIEVSADIPMTYTYYKVPGEARAVVDIADADPEKVEPLIVVNKGAVASISVDKALISGMTVSRLVFNLVAESDIAVTQAPDRKTLHISFTGGKAIATQPVAVPPAAPVVSEPPVSAAPAAVAPPPPAPAVVEPASKTAVKEEQDPLGLDEPQPAVAPVTASPAVVMPVKKLEPVVPADVPPAVPAATVVKGIIVGASYIDIQLNGSAGKFKTHRLAQPERLLIEIPGTSAIAIKNVQVNRFGLSKVRIGTTPGTVRVVLDAARSSFPRYEIVNVTNGLRVNFK